MQSQVWNNRTQHSPSTSSPFPKQKKWPGWIKSKGRGLPGHPQEQWWRCARVVGVGAFGRWLQPHKGPAQVSTELCCPPPGLRVRRSQCRESHLHPLAPRLAASIMGPPQWSLVLIVFLFSSVHNYLHGDLINEPEDVESHHVIAENLIIMQSC